MLLSRDPTYCYAKAPDDNMWITIIYHLKTKTTFASVRILLADAMFLKSGTTV